MSGVRARLDRMHELFQKAERAFVKLNSTVEDLKFDPAAAACVAGAIAAIEQAVDEEVEPHRSNTPIRPPAARTREMFCQAIEKKAVSGQE